jgi:hypothetical protein
MFLRRISGGTMTIDTSLGHKPVAGMAAAAVLCAGIVFGCVAGSGAAYAQERTSTPTTQATPVAPDPVVFAMPPDADIDRDATNIVGDRVHWYGVLVFSSHLDSDEIQQFYTTNLPRNGWVLLSSLIAKRVVLQFINRSAGRACIITINQSSLWSNTSAEIVVAPLTSEAR